MYTGIVIKSRRSRTCFVFVSYNINKHYIITQKLFTLYGKMGKSFWGSFAQLCRVTVDLVFVQLMCVHFKIHLLIWKFSIIKFTIWIGWDELKTIIQAWSSRYVCISIVYALIDTTVDSKAYWLEFQTIKAPIFVDSNNFSKEETEKGKKQF